MVDAAEDGHDHHLSGFRPEHEVGEYPTIKDAIQRAGETGKKPRDHEGRQPIRAHIQPDKGRAFRIIADGGQHAPERRMDDPLQGGEAQRHQHDSDEIEQVGCAEIPKTGERPQPVEIRIRNVGKAFIASGHRIPGKRHRPNYLRKCQRQHSEVDFRQPDAEKPRDQREQSRTQPGGQEGRQKWHAIRLHQDAADVSADPEIRSVPEGNEPGGAQQQIEADREQRIDRNLGAEERVVARSHPGHHQCGQKRDQGPWNVPRGHRIGCPNRPQGRTIRITTIRANTENSENPGKIRMPNARTSP